MEQFLTKEDKIYLRRICNYFGSLGMVEGTIDIELDYDDYKIYEDLVNWDEITYFSNKYTAEIPDGLKIILKKIWNGLLGKEFEMDTDNINWQGLSFNIDCDSKEIVLYHHADYYDTEDGTSREYDGEDAKRLLEKWFSNGEIEIPDGNILTVQFNGSGDDGYIEGTFEENGSRVPDEIEDWCYNELSLNFGAWGDNEGSQGSFVFDLNNSTITNYHTWNTLIGESDRVYEESFELK